MVAAMTNAELEAMGRDLVRRGLLAEDAHPTSVRIAVASTLAFGRVVAELPMFATEEVLLALLEAARHAAYEDESRTVEQLADFAWDLFVEEAERALAEAAGEVH